VLQKQIVECQKLIGHSYIQLSYYLIKSSKSQFHLIYYSRKEKHMLLIIQTNYIMIVL